MSELGKIRVGEGPSGRLVFASLGPGCDLLKSLKEIIKEKNVKSGLIVSGVGCLQQATIRGASSFPEELPMTDQNRVYVPKKEPLELLSLQGNIARKDDGEVYIHCHITVSSGLEKTRAYGGHLIEGCIVHPYVEIAIAEVTGLEIKRREDPEFRALGLYFDS
ncbi:PPC domain-containing DNA-binding protein [Chloroflexota bacterium]